MQNMMKWLFKLQIAEQPSIILIVGLEYAQKTTNK